MKSLVTERTQTLKEAALRHGFMGVGVSRAEFMEEEATRLEAWLSKGYHGEMAYMANHFDMRVDPTKLVPGAKSVVSLIYNYYPGNGQVENVVFAQAEDLDMGERMPDDGYQIPDEVSNQLSGTFDISTERRLTTHGSTDAHQPQLTKGDSFKISRYAYGEDYHKVIRKKLKALVAELREEIGDFHARIFVDSAPIMERDWAKRSGQGWVGKNTLLINPKKGSYFFLAEIILDVEFEYDHPIRDHCGTCTRCIDACPTEAISPEGYILDGSKCISYLTIELKSKIPETFKGKMEDWIFGCDICQDVCPWNKFATPHDEPAFGRNDKVSGMKKEDWMEITEEVFDELFEKSPLKRTGHGGLIRNIQFASGKHS